MGDYYKNRFRIESTRFKGWDYADFGCYYITIVTHNRVNYFGKIVNGKIIYNDIGNIVRNELLRSFEIRAELKLKEYIVMPNHIHMIVQLRKDRVTMYNKDNIPVLFRKPKSISSFVSSFKSSTVSKVDDWIDESNVDIPKFNRENPLWQRNYYDNIIKDEQEFMNVSNYIIANPKNWNDDKDYNGEFLY
jgi:REP element-mobilizing transposase RayT